MFLNELASFPSYTSLIPRLYERSGYEPGARPVFSLSVCRPTVGAEDLVPHGLTHRVGGCFCICIIVVITQTTFKMRQVCWQDLCNIVAIVSSLVKF